LNKTFDAWVASSSQVRKSVRGDLKKQEVHPNRQEWSNSQLGENNNSTEKPNRQEGEMNIEPNVPR
jgi:hypothetical protein